jgi:hypothetical protein
MAEERINRKLAAICAFMNANSLRQLPLGETRKDTSCPQLSPGDDVRHGSASIYLPMEGNCNRGGARGAGACAQPRQSGAWR